MDVNKMNKEVIVTKEKIQDRCKALGQELTKDYKDKNLLVVSLLKGAFVFTADLVREINLPTRIEFMTTSSYGHDTKTSGLVKVKQDLEIEDLSDYDVLIVDDITDSAITMTEVISHLKERNPKSIQSCVLLDKPSRRKVDYEPDYIGFEIPDKFIVGYGLNYGHYYRNEDHVFAFVEK